jgi:hypothetical protein
MGYSESQLDRITLKSAEIIISKNLNAKGCGVSIFQDGSLYVIKDRKLKRG